MTGRIESGLVCTVVAIDLVMLEVGDVVLRKVVGNEYLHTSRPFGLAAVGARTEERRRALGPNICYRFVTTAALVCMRPSLSTEASRPMERLVRAKQEHSGGSAA